MSKHKSEDYKISAVKYYLNNDISLDDVCRIFDCPKQSLYRWVKRYEELEEIKRLNIKAISYKITKEQVKYARTLHSFSGSCGRFRTISYRAWMLLRSLFTCKYSGFPSRTTSIKLCAPIFRLSKNAIS